MSSVICKVKVREIQVRLTLFAFNAVIAASYVTMWIQSTDLANKGCLMPHPHWWRSQPCLYVSACLCTIEYVSSYSHMSSTWGQSGGTAWRLPYQRSMSVWEKEWHQRCSGDTVGRLPSECPCWETERGGKQRGRGVKREGRVLSMTFQEKSVLIISIDWCTF